MILVLRDEKPKCIFLLARVCKQAIWKCSGYGIFIQCPFYIETF